MASHDQPAGVAVVGVQPVALPRVVAEHDLGPQLADDPGHVATRSPGRSSGRRRRGRGSAPRRRGRRPAGGPPRAARPGGGRRAPAGRRTGPTCPWSRPCTRGGGRRSRRPPTWPACRRRRTRRRRGGRRWPAPTPAPAGRASTTRRAVSGGWPGSFAATSGGGGRASGGSRSSGLSTSRASRGSRRTSTRQPAAIAAARWRLERARAVGGRRARCVDRQGQHVGAVAAAVGHERDGAGDGDGAEVVGQRAGRCGR